MTFSAILFDCDGVLVDSEVIYVEVERAHLSRIGLTYSLSDYQSRFNGLTSTDFFAAVAEDYKALGKGPFPDDFASALDEATLIRLDQDLAAVSGIEGLLDAYKGPKAVASSSRLQRLHRKLRKTGLHHHFAPHIYSGEQVEKGKPAPDLFLHSAAKLQKEPGECLVIEDSVNGVLAGLAAGMTVWGFAGGGHADETLKSRLLDAGAAEAFSSHGEMAQRLNQ